MLRPKDLRASGLEADKSWPEWEVERLDFFSFFKAGSKEEELMRLEASQERLRASKQTELQL